MVFGGVDGVAACRLGGVDVAEVGHSQPLAAAVACRHRRLGDAAVAAADHSHTPAAVGEVAAARVEADVRDAAVPMVVGISNHREPSGCQPDREDVSNAVGALQGRDHDANYHACRRR